MSRLDDLQARIHARRESESRFRCAKCARMLAREDYGTASNGTRRLSCRSCCGRALASRRAREGAVKALRESSTVAKKCCACQTMKPLAEYHVSETAADGRQSRCKACMSRYSRERCLPASLTPEGRVQADNAGVPFRVKHVCPICCDLAHRRRSPVCPQCGEPREELGELRADQFGGMRSSAALAVNEG